MDHWGEADTSVAARMAAFCASMPEVLLDKPQLKLDGTTLTPREALAAVQADSALGRRIAKQMAKGGIVTLTKPNEARFR